ncbi:peptidase [Parabacteroides goldsteinii]|uniref:peptidase n=1 Tax=Parabacteroides goldsteinii TaxID=328812 RepID=UPI001CC96061|nr:peptidase [Parabacteroides goldsteinii]UBD75703.1 peptidase [Parabacteroides goldsteinii]
MTKFTFILHDETVNTKGFRMLTSGGDFSVFENNPVMLLNHNDWELPIGRWENIRVEGTKVLADAVFDEEDENALAIKGKVDRGFLKAASIGAWPGETSNDPALMLPGQTYPTFVTWTAREASICTIGSNHNALALYDKDNKLIDLDDKNVLIKLFDTGNGVSPIKSNNKMSILTGLLNLSDSASEQAQAEEVKKIIQMRDNLHTENGTLKTENASLKAKVELYDGKEKETRKNTAIQLVDAAIKDCRLNAQGKESWLKMFDADFDVAKAQLAAIPAHKPIAPQIQTGTSNTGKIELSDMSFDQIVKADRLKDLKKDSDLYKKKFYEAYGKYPA